MCRVLILSGMNNHDWQRTTPYIKEILETADFKVDVTESVSECLSDYDNIKDYDVIVSEYNGTPWSESAEANFIKKISDGCGVVSLHAANNWAMNFTEYEKMLGYNWINDVSGHGHYHEFLVNFKEKSHPILNGIEEFRIKDELYHKLSPKHDIPYTIIAEAYSAEDKLGSGNYEPMVITTEYGNGRCVHNMLGHVWNGGEMSSVENESYKKLLINCCLWAVNHI
jgi:Uncharacterized protein conserved in bacteria